MKRILLYTCLLIFALSACKKETHLQTREVNDYTVFEVNSEKVYNSSAEKTKQKSAAQYLSSLYNNLFNKSLPQDELIQMSEIRTAMGDKQMADELFVNSFINRNGVQVPSDSEMRSDIKKFVEETYLRFFLRDPTPYELIEMIRLIEEDPEITPEMVYQGFAISNEYKFY